jgi:hypothetical protein
MEVVSPATPPLRAPVNIRSSGSPGETWPGARVAIGVALAGSILIAALTTSFLQSVTENPDIPSSVKEQANVQLANGIPFMSDADLQAALDEAGVSPEVATEAIEANDQARVDGLRTALAVLALVTLPGLLVARAIPKTPK